MARRWIAEWIGNDGGSEGAQWFATREEAEEFLRAHNEQYGTVGQVIPDDSKWEDDR